MAEEEKENTQTTAEDAPSVDEASTGDPVDSAVADDQDGPVVTRKSLARWLAAAAKDLSACFGKTTSAEVASLSSPTGDDLKALPASCPVAVAALVSAAGASMPLLLLAPESSVLALAREAVKDKTDDTLDDAALEALTDVAARFLSGLEAALKGEGFTGLSIKPSQGQRIESISDDFGSPGVCLAAVTLSPEGAEPIPLTLLFGDFSVFSRSGQAGAASARPSDAAAPNLDRIMNISVPLVVEIARTRVRLRKVLSFKPGSVLEFAKKSDDLLDLMVGHARIARGEAVKVGESFGLRVLEVGSLKERIKSLSK